MGVWGTNFVVIKMALGDLPPLLFAALRFILVLPPAAVFLPRPAVPLGNLAAYGVLIGVGQFGLLYLSMDGLISPGIAPFVIQSQVFFTIGLAAVVGRRAHSRLSIFLPFARLPWHCAHHPAHRWNDNGGRIGDGALCCAIVGAANIVAKVGRPGDMLAYVVWSSAFAVPPLLLLSLVFEGYESIAHALGQMDTFSWLAVVWQAWGNTLFDTLHGDGCRSLSDDNDRADGFAGSNLRHGRISAVTAKRCHRGKSGPPRW